MKVVWQILDVLARLKIWMPVQNMEIFRKVPWVHNLGNAASIVIYYI